MAQVPRELTPGESALHYFGAELRRWRMLRGMSQHALGRAVLHSGDLIGKIEKALRWPTDELAARCDQALSTDGTLSRLLSLVHRERRRTSSAGETAVGTPSASGEVEWAAGEAGLPDVVAPRGVSTDRRLLLLGTIGLAGEVLLGLPNEGALEGQTFSGRPVVTDELVGAFEAVTRSYRLADYETGARTVSVGLHHHLQSMLSVRGRPATSLVERRLLYAIGDAAQLAAWFAIDQQHYETARRYCQLALSAAREGGDRAMEAYLLGQVGYIHLHAKDGGGAVRVLTTAYELAGRNVAPAVRSWIAEGTGEAHALAGETAAGLRALHQSEVTFDGARPDNTPPWLAFYNDECHAVRLKGRCLMRLGRADDSTEALTEALRILPDTFVRERSGTLIDLAFAHLHRGQPEIEESCRVAGDALDLARHTDSGRNLRRVGELLIELLPHGHLPAVQDLHQQFLLT